MIKLKFPTLTLKLTLYDIADLMTNLKIYLDYLKDIEKKLIDTQEERGENCMTDTELFESQDRIEWTKNFIVRVRRKYKYSEAKREKESKRPQKTYENDLPF